MKTKRWIYTLLLPLLALWVVMSAFSIGLYEHEKHVDDRGEGWVSLAGLDGSVYLQRYSWYTGALRIRKRHPAEPIIAAPWVFVGGTVRYRAGGEAAKIALILLSTALSVVTVFLLWLVTKDWGAVAIWLSFAYVWLLASAPELFAMSQTVLIGTLLMVRQRVTDLRAWGGMALLAGGITITNGIKPLAAFVCTSGRTGESLRLLRKHARAILVSVGIALFVFVALEMVKWRFLDGQTFAQEVQNGCDYITDYFTGGFSWSERLQRIWEIFLLEPLMTHGAIFGQQNAQGLDLLPLGYRGPIPHIVGVVLYGLCIWSAWQNRHEKVVIAALVMVSFDFLLHVVVGWGLIEAQIYCGHWFYIIPVLMAGLKGRSWKFALAALIAAWNLQFLV